MYMYMYICKYKATSVFKLNTMRSRVEWR